MKVSRSIRDLHSDLEDYARPLAIEVEDILRDYAEANKWSFDSRRKELISFAQKIEMGMYKTFEEIDDFYACEIVVINLKDIQFAKQFIYSNFDVVEEKPKKVNRADSFSFDGVRIYAKLKEGVAGPKAYSWMRFEIQVKTLLEKAWGEATHDLTYKCKEVMWGTERLVYQLRAILNHADIVFSEIENISKSCLPSISSTQYDEINRISEWIYEDWPPYACPENMKRLSETIENLCSSYKLPFDELKALVRHHRDEHGALENLSVYSSILQAVLNSNHKEFWKIAKTKHRWRQLILVIPPEVETPEDILGKIHPSRCVFIGSLSFPTG